MLLDLLGSGGGMKPIMLLPAAIEGQRIRLPGCLKLLIYLATLSGRGSLFVLWAPPDGGTGYDSSLSFLLLPCFIACDVGQWHLVDPTI